MIRFKYILLVGLFLGALNVTAQDGWDPGHEDPWQPGEPGEDIPIDGGALALLAGGAALGYKALKKKKSED